MRVRYRIGEMAELFGMTKEGIRYLERRGIIRSQREENGYRTYSRSEISQLKHIRSLCSMGFSLDEAERMICDMPRGELLSALDEKLTELDRRAQELSRMRTTLTEQRDALERALMRGEGFELIPCPDMIFFPRDVREAEERVRAVEKAWFAAMPTVMMCALYGEEDEVKGSAVSEADARALSLPVLDGMLRLGGRMCVHGVLEAKLYGKPDMRPLREWMAARGLQPAGRVFCLVRMTYRGEDAQRWTIHEVYQPVKEK